jgi:glucose-6-phosphate isomerase
MALQSINPTQTQAWKKLQAHFETMKNVQMQQLFANEPARAEQMHLQWNDFLVDYSKNIISAETISLLQELANEVQLKDAITKYFDGDVINQTENRAVLHTALRAKENASVKVDGVNVMPEIYSVKNKIKNFSNEIISGQRKGFSGKPFTDVVNIGIGGSDLGPAMIVEALQYYKNDLNVHFVSNVDGDHVNEIIKKINPETTLFVIVSKTFSTQETLSNAETIRSWFLQSATQEDLSLIHI